MSLRLSVTFCDVGLFAPRSSITSLRPVYCSFARIGFGQQPLKPFVHYGSHSPFSTSSSSFATRPASPPKGQPHLRVAPPVSTPKVTVPTSRTVPSPAVPDPSLIKAVKPPLSAPLPVATNDLIARRGGEPRDWPWNPMPDGEHEFRIVFARPTENDRENPRLPSPRGTVRNFVMLLCAVGIFVWLARNESIAGGVHYSTWFLGAMTVFTTFLVCTTFRHQWHMVTQIQAIQRSGTGRPKFILAHGGHSALPKFLQSRARLRSFDPEQVKLYKSPNDDSALILDFDHQQPRYLPSRWNKGYTIDLKDSAKLRKVADPSTEAVVSLDRLEWLFGRARDASERHHYRTLGFWYLPKRS